MATKVRKKNETAITFSENLSIFYISPSKCINPVFYTEINNKEIVKSKTEHIITDTQDYYIHLVFYRKHSIALLHRNEKEYAVLTINTQLCSFISSAVS